MANSDDEHETTYIESGLMAAGITVGPDGISQPVPQHEAIATAIPLWVRLREHEAETLSVCLRLTSHGHPAVRAAAVAAFGDLARRYGRLAERERVERAIELGLRDRDSDVRGAASRSADTVEARLGWTIERPGA